MKKTWIIIVSVVVALAIVFGVLCLTKVINFDKPAAEEVVEEVVEEVAPATEEAAPATEEAAPAETTGSGN